MGLERGGGGPYSNRPPPLTMGRISKATQVTCPLDHQNSVGACCVQCVAQWDPAPSDHVWEMRVASLVGTSGCICVFAF